MRRASRSRAKCIILFARESCVLFELISPVAWISFIVISCCFCRFCQCHCHWSWTRSWRSCWGCEGDGQSRVPETDYHQWATLLVSLDAVKAHGMEQKMLAMRCLKTLLYVLFRTKTPTKHPPPPATIQQNIIFSAAFPSSSAGFPSNSYSVLCYFVSVVVAKRLTAN